MVATRRTLLVSRVFPNLPQASIHGFVRAASQSDEADALCTANELQAADTEGRLGALLDVSGIAAHHHAAVEFEGWIIGQQS